MSLIEDAHLALASRRCMDHASAGLRHPASLRHGAWSDILYLSARFDHVQV